MSSPTETPITDKDLRVALMMIRPFDYIHSSKPGQFPTSKPIYTPNGWARKLVFEAAFKGDASDALAECVDHLGPAQWDTWKWLIRVAEHLKANPLWQIPDDPFDASTWADPEVKP